MEVASMKTLNVISAAVVLSLLGACSGGGGGSGTNVFTGAGTAASAADGGTSGATGATAAAPSVNLTLSSRTVTSAAPVQVTAKVLDAKGVGLAGKVVTFSSLTKLGDFSSTTALTDATGSATVALFPAANAKTGADTVSATATVSGAAVESSTGFQLTATDVAIADFSSPSVAAGTKLSAYGQADLTLTLSGAANGTPVSLSLNSLCVGKGKASLTPLTATTTNGKATFTYKDLGCGATEAADTLQAAVTGSLANKSLSINLASPSVSSVTFSSATPEIIYLKGSGLTETSQVIFQVRDLAGNPLPNQDVTLEATTLAGGLTIDGGAVPVVKKSDSGGNVTIRVNSGTVPTPMRVKATLGGAGGIATVSSSLSIAVGLPSQLNFSLSQETRNIEGYNIDGTKNAYNIIASDRLGNPVSPGTAINFVSEGGQVVATAQTGIVNGSARASVNFLSSEPRPVNGRVTVLAYALGEESFLDANGNNVYDPGEAFQDLGSPFLNRAFDNSFNPVTDQFFALSGGADSSSACAAVEVTTDPLLFKDPLLLLSPRLDIQTRPGTCDSKWGRAYVRRSVETVFSTSGARPFLVGFPRGMTNVSASCAVTELEIDSLTNKQVFSNLGSYKSQTSTAFLPPAILANSSKVGFVDILAADMNPQRLNPMAAGTAVTVEATTGLAVKISGGSPVPNTLEANVVGVEYEFADDATSGTITVSFQSPSRLKTAVAFGVLRGAYTGPSPCP
jgi:hypothetical protein